MLYPDAGGTRPVIRQMAERLSAMGYAVLVPDVYYRHGSWAPFDMKAVFGEPPERQRLFGLMKSVTPEVMAADARAFFDYLAGRPEVTGERFGTTGYRMGGRTSLVVAGRVPEQVAAAMSFHGGGLATDDSGSPHLLADRIQAAVYVGAAENDPSHTPSSRQSWTQRSPPPASSTPSSGIRLHTDSRCPTTPPMTRRLRSGTGRRRSPFRRASAP